MSFEDLKSSLRGARRRLGGARQDPTQAVASGVFQIRTAVSTFQRLVNSLGTAKDTPDLREQLHKTRLQIAQLVKDTSSKLKQASVQPVSASKEIADAKLAKDFQTILREFQKAQRLAAERETAYTPFSSQAAVKQSSYNGSDDTSSEKLSEQRPLVESQRKELWLLDNEIVLNEEIEERLQGTEEIQQDIAEINEIFKDIALLVRDQGTMIDDIQTNIEGSGAATAQGRTQLEKASNIQMSNSSLVCLLLVILLVIFGIIPLIVVIVLVA